MSIHYSYRIKIPQQKATMAQRRYKVNELIEVRESTIQGRGVFARKRIQPGRKIIEYTGERISSDEVDRRYDDENMERHHTFLFEVDDDVVIDAAVGGNEARFINHSCEPNCEAIQEDDQIYIYSKRNIQPGVELAYDYQYDLDEPLTPELIRRYPCYCGAAKCRGTILKPKRKRRRKSKNSR